MKLTIGNSTCRLEGFTEKQYKQMRELCSYRISAQAEFYTGGHRSPKRYLMTPRGNFPSGLLYLIENYIKKHQLKPQVVDTRQRPKGLGTVFRLDLGYLPYTEQQEAAEACLREGRGMVVAPTGVGKTTIAALIINKLQVKTLVVVPTLGLKAQVTSDLSKAFPNTRVGSLASFANIAVENVDALDPRKPLKGYDCVIIDEIHHSGAKTYRKLNRKAWEGVYYKLGLTATPFRSQENERLLMESVLSKVIYRIEYLDAVKKGYIVPMEAYYYELPVDTAQAEDLEGRPWATVYSTLVVNNAPRNYLIIGLLTRLAARDYSSLCLVKEIRHGENLTSLVNLPFVKGENTDNREKILEFNLGEINTLTATTGVMGEGIDTKPAEFIIIAGLGKSKNAFMQQVGRGFRRYPGKESCKIILFYDKTHKFTRRHFKAQVKYLREEYGIVPVKLELP